MTWILNSFSLNLVAHLPAARADIRRLTLPEARAVAQTATSAVGHADTAERYSQELELAVPFHRQTIRLQVGDQALVGQYVGPRLPLKTEARPDVATTWFLVTVAAGAPADAGPDR